ncbi:MAG: glycosyltransferase family 39 protein [Candidatus Hydrogenedentes bacterium]|nr:glycosyltransferase family 39 protein [Candidatus Hydrogenedentota bacterium]
MKGLTLPHNIPVPVFVVCAALTLAFLFLEGMTSPLNHDEDHYLAGAVMAKDHAIYQGFTYSAMPLHPMIMGAYLRLVPTEYPFWHFRAASALLMALGGLFLFLAVRHTTRNDTVSLILTAFLLFNTLVLYSTNGLISCHIPALTFALGGAWALQHALLERSRAWAALCGAFFCLAAGFKLYYFLLLPELLVLFYFVHPGGESPKQRLRLGAAYVIGTLPAGLPTLWVFFHDPHAFMFNNYIFHQYNTAWRIAIGDLGRISLSSRVGYTLEKLGYTGNAAIAITLIALAIGLGRTGLVQRFKAPNALPLVWAIVAITATIGCMLPRPMHLHYLVFPLPFYILLAASLYPALEASRLRSVHIALTICALVVLVSGGRYLFQEGLTGLAPARWIPTTVHHEARAMATALAHHPEPHLVSTLSPLLVVEAGLPFDQAFSGSAFFYRVGDVIPADVQQQLGLVQDGHGLDHLESLMPAAILTGFEADHEHEFLAFAAKHGYAPWHTPILGQGVLYLRPVN